MNDNQATLPCIDWNNDFPNGELPSSDFKSNDKRTAILLLAIDTEYQSNYIANSNLCLSYQYAIYDLSSQNYQSGILYPDINQQERYTLSVLTKKILENFNIVLSSLEGYRIIYIAHYFAAEWSMLKDRKDLYMKFEYIRKTLITTNRPLKTSLIDEDGNKVHLFADVRDTMLLLPDGYKSLEKASTFIEGFEKIDIPSYYKSNMYQYLQEYPAKFEEYAIRDAEVTLKLFIKLQFMLNQINGTTDKLFSTLASATTNDFIKFSKSHNTSKDDDIHQMQFSRLYSKYQEHSSLANRGYLGGLNSSYHIGKSTGYTFIDIDFKNAYPTAMNLLKIGDFGQKVKKVKYKKFTSKVDLGAIA